MSKNSKQARSKVLIALLFACISLLATFAWPVSAAEQAQNSVVSEFTKDGRKFEALTDEDVEKLSDDEFDKYHKWKISKKQALIEQKTKENEEKRALVEQKTKEHEEINASLIAEYKNLIKKIKGLHARKDQSSAYSNTKNLLKKVLLARDPPEIIPELEKIRYILMEE